MVTETSIQIDISEEEINKVVEAVRNKIAKSGYILISNETRQSRDLTPEQLNTYNTLMNAMDVSEKSLR